MRDTGDGDRILGRSHFHKRQLLLIRYPETIKNVQAVLDAKRS